MITEKQKWARRRNWLIMRFMGARSIFSWDNIIFMSEAIKDKDTANLVIKCDKAINDLIDALRKTTQN